ncbi:MAG: tRNA pseudouridine(55) synthase TruB [Legionellales bacterium RIFCSPHIGHO2_12_FULL_42_9]|nr:MAG: tRNA pseudouridine(55) synthase TruB [Legionellales bacterium RIFCSPHIGHO2_12_FULL_42_9]
MKPIQKTERGPVDGILLLNKPLGFTSNAVLQKIKRHYRAEKAGHTGSLDPLATGMLPICFGEATKFGQYVLDSDKTYRATGLLGSKTSTGDVAGEIIASVSHIDVSEEALWMVLKEFQGETLQRPSMFSALKHQGVPLYRYARKGIVIERDQRPIYIHELQLLNYDGRQFVIQVSCGKGTYIRNLVEDIGEKLGTYAHVIQLHRLYTNGYANQVMYDLDELLAMNQEQLQQCLLPMDTPVSHLPEVLLFDSETADLQQGKVITKQGGTEGLCARLYDETRHFVGLGTWIADHLLRAKRLVRREDRR